MLSSQRLCPSSCSSFVAFIAHLEFELPAKSRWHKREESSSLPIVESVHNFSKKAHSPRINRKSKAAQLSLATVGDAGMCTPFVEALIKFATSTRLPRRTPIPAT